jgi:hypothetical protein
MSAFNSTGSSIFGAAKPTSNLFGGVNATSQGTTSSPFGAAASQSASGGQDAASKPAMPSLCMFLGDFEVTVSNFE